MPMYEYRCESNGRLVEVQHRMDERLLTWGELCERAGISAGRTDPQARVEKLMSAGFISVGGSPGTEAAACEAPGCGAAACGGGFCGGGDF
jgi:predicted nucleic acid-binding Zn ribbon protein